MLFGKACTEVSTSARLHHLLHLILVTGNILNSGKSSGAAEGFRLEALLKLEDTKDNASPNKTLVHILVQFIMEEDSPLLDTIQDIPSVVAVSECKFSVEHETDIF
jgi:hypothetical protein